MTAPPTVQSDVLFRPEPIRWVQEAFGPGHVETFHVIGEFGTSWGILLGAGLTLWFFGRRALYTLLALAVVEGAVRRLLSMSFAVDRPAAEAVVHYVQRDLPSSFPSGHVATATAIWVFVALTARVPLLAALLIPLAVGVARLYLGVHFLADVVGGWVLGGGLAWAAARRRDDIGAWLLSRGPRIGAAVALAAVVLAVGRLVVAGGNRFAWNAAGFVCGAAGALLLEARFVAYRAPNRLREGFRAAAPGVVGVGVPFAVGVATTGAPVGATLIFLAALWAFLVTPAWANRRIPDAAAPS